MVKYTALPLRNSKPTEKEDAWIFAIVQAKFRSVSEQLW